MPRRSGPRRHYLPVRRRMADTAAGTLFDHMASGYLIDRLIDRLREVGHAALADRIERRRRFNLSIDWETERAQHLLGEAAT